MIYEYVVECWVCVEVCVKCDCFVVECVVEVFDYGLLLLYGNGDV